MFCLFRSGYELKATFLSSQPDVAALRPQARELIKDLWRELDHYYRKLDYPSRRNNCRLWGVTYVNDGKKAGEDGPAGGEKVTR